MNGLKRQRSPSPSGHRSSCRPRYDGHGEGSRRLSPLPSSRRHPRAIQETLQGLTPLTRTIPPRTSTNPLSICQNAITSPASVPCRLELVYVLLPPTKFISSLPHLDLCHNDQSFFFLYLITSDSAREFPGWPSSIGPPHCLTQLISTTSQQLQVCDPPPHTHTYQLCSSCSSNTPTTTLLRSLLPIISPDKVAVMLDSSFKMHIEVLLLKLAVVIIVKLGSPSSLFLAAALRDGVDHYCNWNPKCL